MNKMYYIAKVNQLQYTINRINTIVNIDDLTAYKEAVEVVRALIISNSKMIEDMDNHADDESYFI